MFNYTKYRMPQACELVAKENKKENKKEKKKEKKYLGFLIGYNQQKGLWILLGNGDVKTFYRDEIKSLNPVKVEKKRQIKRIGFMHSQTSTPILKPSEENLNLFISSNGEEISFKAALKIKKHRVMFIKSQQSQQWDGSLPVFEFGKSKELQFSGTGDKSSKWNDNRRLVDRDHRLQDRKSRRTRPTYQRPELF